MNVARFLEHWSITENPFKAEEARHDAVFARLDADAIVHPDFEKIVGDLSRPASAIVFGEKGSGKTAIRLQIAQRVAEHNARNPDDAVLLVPYDDFNPLLESLCRGVRVETDGDRMDVLQRLKSLRLVDHLDGILHVAVPIVVDRILDSTREGTGSPAWRILRRGPIQTRRDLMLLQVLYDRHDGYAARGALLRRRLGLGWNRHRMLWKGLAVFGWIPAAAIALASLYVSRDWIGPKVWLYGFCAALALWALLIVNWAVVERWIVLRQLARRLAKQTRVVNRSVADLARALEHLPPEDRTRASLPVDSSEERRYHLLARLRRAVEPLGFTGMIIVVDRVDEPTLVSGDVDSMRALVWPMLNNKFLQQEGVGPKLLLPIELRHELFRESAAFFQGARLDKQNLVERLAWSGASLYDLCNARLRACRPAGAQPIMLLDLFDEEVTRQDLVDALDQMHQPRDAFKLLYQCIQEHCSNVTEDQARWRIPRLVLDTVRKQQAERVQMVQRGYRPG